MRTDLNQDALKIIFDYQPDTGFLVWRNRPEQGSAWNGRYAGRVAGAFPGRGYGAVPVIGKQHLIHRVIWTYFNGEIPEGIWIDHIDRDLSNNKIENLRLACPSENSMNKAASRNNTSGLKGIGYSKIHEKWRATIRYGGKTYRDHFDSLEDAVAAYNRTAQEIAGSFAYLNEAPREGGIGRVMEPFKKLPSSNTSGFRGASFHKPTGVWRSFINVRGKRYNLGTFESAELAGAAYAAASLELRKPGTLNKVESERLSLSGSQS